MPAKQAKGSQASKKTQEKKKEKFIEVRRVSEVYSIACDWP